LCDAGLVWRDSTIRCLVIVLVERACVTAARMPAADWCLRRTLPLRQCCVTSHWVGGRGGPRGSDVVWWVLCSGLGGVVAQPPHTASSLARAAEVPHATWSSCPPRVPAPPCGYAAGCYCGALYLRCRSPSVLCSRPGLLVGVVRRPVLLVACPPSGGRCAACTRRRWPARLGEEASAAALLRRRCRSGRRRVR